MTRIATPIRGLRLFITLGRVINKPSALRIPARKVANLAVMVALALRPQPLCAMPLSGGDTVQGLYDALLITMKNGRTLGQSGRFAQLAPVIRRTFDVPTMARLSIGPSWATLTDAQRQQMTESFGRYISAIYADRFDSYSGQKLQVTTSSPPPRGLWSAARSSRRTASRSRWII
jgi:phospholipid transport system substrate-binding protein